MREKRKGRKLISRIFAGLICAILVATLLPGLPGNIASAADPIDINSNIKGIRLEYRTSGSDSWTVYTNPNQIPGDADIRANIDYEIPAAGGFYDSFVESDYKLQFSFPKEFYIEGGSKDIDLIDTQTSSVAGTVEVRQNTSDSSKDGTATLNFDSAWATSKQQEITDSGLKGSFVVQGKLDLDKLNGDSSQKMKFGSFDFDFTPEKDFEAKYAQVEIAKELDTPALTEAGGKKYLNYIVKVTAENKVEKVVVKDIFTDGSNYAVSYGTISETSDVIGATAGSVAVTPTIPGGYVWNIPSMVKGEVRTLKYPVEIDGTNYFAPANAGTAIKNVAKVYLEKSDSSLIEKDEANAIYSSNATVNVTKAAGTPVKIDSTGSYEIPYTVTVSAPSTNDYTINPVIIKDEAIAKNGTKVIDANLFSYKKDTQEINILPAAGNKNSFTFNAESLNPGDSKTLTYKIEVSEAAFAAGNYNTDNNLSISNTVGAYDDKNGDGAPDNKLGEANTTADIANKKFLIKSKAEKTASEITESMSEVYLQNGALDSTLEYTIPAGSTPYTLIINEEGWDARGTVIKDSLSTDIKSDAGVTRDFIQFRGYAKVEAFAPATPGTILKTSWVKIDGGDSFSFKPQDIGFSADTFKDSAYKISYYTEALTNNFPTMRATNTARLEGSIIGVSGAHDLVPVNTQQVINLDYTGSLSFSTAKRAWYYEAPNAALIAEGYNNGALYWLLNAKASRMPAGVIFQDSTNYSSKNNINHHDESPVVAVLKGGELPGSYANIEELRADVGPDKAYTALAKGTDYEISYGDKLIAEGGKENYDCNVTTLNELTFTGDESLWVVIRTEPTKLPNAEESIKYDNKVNVKDSFTQTWKDGSKITANQASQTLISDANIFTRYSEFITVDETDNMKVEESNSSKRTSVNPAFDYGLGAGSYVSWDVLVNQDAQMEGTYRVRHKLSAGQEPAYLSLYSVGDSVKTDPPRTKKITDLGADWEEHEVETMLNGVTIKNYWYSKGLEVVYEVENVTKAQSGTASANAGKYGMYFQLISRVTSEDYLMGGKLVGFENNIEIYKNGNLEGQSHADVEKKGASIKKGLINESTLKEADGTFKVAVLPFSLEVNDLGEDLTDGDTITLIDKVEGSLAFTNLNELKVYDKDKQELDWATNKIAVSYDSSKGELRITIPDNKHLFIEYKAAITALEGQKVFVSNKVYWEGADEPTGEWKPDMISYSLAAKVETGTEVAVEIKKTDRDAWTNKLSGAQFAVRKGTISGSTVSWVDITTNLVTGATGVAKQGALEYDTLYELEEIKAPDGYEMPEKTKKYFIVAKNKVSDITANIDDWNTIVGDDIALQLAAVGSTYTYDVSNVKKSSSGGDTTPPGDPNPKPDPNPDSKPPVGPEKPNNGGGGTSGGGGGSTGGGGGGTSGGGGGGTPPLTVPPVTVPGPVLDTTSTTPTPAPTAPSTPEGTPEAPAVTPEGTPVVEGAPAVEGTPEAPAPPAPAVTVTFQSELGNIPAPQTMTPGQVAYNPGAPLDPASLKPGMVINGQRFEGWYTDPQFKNAYKFGTPVTEDMVLYAKWTKVGEAGKSPKTADNNWMLMLLGGAMAILAFAGIKVVRIKKRDRFS